MTQSDWQKLTVQLQNKPEKLKRFLKYCKPKKRKFGISIHKCVRCGRLGAHVGQYGINMCRQCFREMAESLGFKKYH